MVRVCSIYKYIVSVPCYRSVSLLLVTAVQLKRLPRRSALLCIIVVATCIDGKNLILHCCKMVVVEKIEKAGGAFCRIGGGCACDWYLS